MLHRDEVARLHAVAVRAQQRDAQRVRDVCGGVVPQVGVAVDEREAVGGGLGLLRGPLGGELRLAARRHGHQLGLRCDGRTQRVVCGRVARVQREDDMRPHRLRRARRATLRGRREEAQVFLAPRAELLDRRAAVAHGIMQPQHRRALGAERHPLRVAVDRHDVRW